MFPQLKVRAATPEDLPYLQHRLKLKPRNEQVRLGLTIDLQCEHCGGMTAVPITKEVALEYGGCVVGFAAARLMWQIEPVMLFDEFRQLAPHHARRRGTYMLISAVETWIGDRTLNHSGIYSYFCFITSRVMQKLASSFGMLRIYTGGKFFGKDL